MLVGAAKARACEDLCWWYFLCLFCSVCPIWLASYTRSLSDGTYNANVHKLSLTVIWITECSIYTSGILQISLTHWEMLKSNRWNGSPWSVSENQAFLSSKATRRSKPILRSSPKVMQYTSLKRPRPPIFEVWTGLTLAADSTQTFMSLSFKFRAFSAVYVVFVVPFILAPLRTYNLLYVSLNHIEVFIRGWIQKQKTGKLCKVFSQVIQGVNLYF